MTTKKILIIDDHSEFRKMLGSFIEKQFKDIEIQEAATGEEGIEVAMEERPQIALIDIRLPRMDGIEAAQQIKQYAPGCHILMMSMFKENRYREFAGRNGEAFIDKDEIAEGLIPLLHKFLNRNKIQKQGGGK